MSPARPTPDDLRRQDEAIEAARLYAAGLTSPTAIGERLGLSRDIARKRLRIGLQLRAEEQQELARHARGIIIDRLELIWKANAQKMLTGDPAASRVCRDVLKDYAELTGAAQPVQVELTVQTNDELDRELAELFAALDGTAPPPALDASDDEAPTPE